MNEGEFDTGGVSLEDPKAIEAIVRYDELPPAALERFERDPGARAALERLRAADRWLETLASGPRANEDAEELPTANELYDYGEGPGADPVPPATRAKCDSHLTAHPEERPWVAGLAHTPPSPLIAGEGDVEERPAIARSGAWLVWAPLAAAALVVAMVLGGNDRRNVLAGGLPASPVLRSAASEGGLLFPRGRVLDSASDEDGFAARPLFEVVPVDGASAYEFELRRLTGDAFEPGEVVWTSRSSAPSAAAPSLTGSSLMGRAFEWEVRAIVDGLPRRLGTQTFELEERAVLRALTSTARDGDERAKRAAIRRLHASGFVTDARSIARTLPPSEEREAYLSGR